jgi:molecular chaperone DnaJ
VIDHYAVLGVTRTATADEIKSAHRTLVKKYHPDHGGDVVKFRAVTEAYTTLSDTDKRRAYDDESRAPRFTPFRGSTYTWDDLFKGTARPDFRPRAWGDFTFAHTQHTGSDIVFKLSMSFEEMCLGCAKTFTVTRRVVCPTCHGKGGEDFTSCEFCEGKGKTKDYLHAECGVCNGKGVFPRKTCIQCAGSGLAPKEQTVKLTLPPGVPPDGICELEGYGHESVGGATGDLRTMINVRTHEFFSRNGLNIQCTLKISAFRAILGGDVTVRTIHGDRILLIPPGTQNGFNAILSGEGIHAKDRHGDQHVRIKIIIPLLTTEEKSLLTEMLIGKIITHKPEAELESLKEALR